MDPNSMITIADRSSKKRHIRSFRSPVVEVLGLYYEVTTSHLGADSPPKVICIAPVLGSTSPRERQQLSKSADLQQLLDRGGVLIYPGMSACTDIEQEVHELIDRAREIEKSIYETDVERFRKEQFADRATFAFCGRAQHRLKEVVVDLEKELRCEYQNHVRGVERLQQDLLRFESDNATELKGLMSQLRLARSLVDFACKDADRGLAMFKSTSSKETWRS